MLVCQQYVGYVDVYGLQLVVEGIVQEGIGVCYVCIVDQYVVVFVIFFDVGEGLGNCFWVVQIYLQCGCVMVGCYQCIGCFGCCFQVDVGYQDGVFFGGQLCGNVGVDVYGFVCYECYVGVVIIVIYIVFVDVGGFVRRWGCCF